MCEYVFNNTQYIGIFCLARGLVGSNRSWGYIWELKLGIKVLISIYFILKFGLFNSINIFF